jgi:hypothetical protein
MATKKQENAKTTNPLKMIMSTYHTIKKLGHNIVLKEILLIIYLPSRLPNKQNGHWWRPVNGFSRLRRENVYESVSVSLKRINLIY